MSGKSDIDRAWDLLGDARWDRAEVAAIIATLLAENRRLKRGKRT